MRTVLVRVVPVPPLMCQAAGPDGFARPCAHLPWALLSFKFAGGIGEFMSADPAWLAGQGTYHEKV